MVILFNTEGRFGHQLSQFATLIANSKKYDRPFYHWRFKSRFGNYFSKNADSILLPISLRIIFIFLCYKLLKLFSINKYNIFNTEFQLTDKKSTELVFDDTIEKLFTSNAKYVVIDFVFNDVPNLIKYHEHIGLYLLPNVVLQSKVDSHIKSLNQQYKLLVGLHIRRDDFKEFENGRFYFNDDDYIKVLNQFLEIINLEAKEIVFVICSDEQIYIENYNAFNISYQQRSFQEDFFILSKCDYIIATRSIFSTMANYLSANKIYQIIDVNHQFEMNDFLKSEDLLVAKYNLKEIQDFI